MNSVFNKRMVGLTWALVLVSALSCALVFIRFLVHDTMRYTFFIWNLLICWVPYLLSMLLYSRSMDRRKGNLLNKILWIVWILFIPNALYMVTDLIHLGGEMFYSQGAQIPRQDFGVWYDFIIHLFFIMVGFVLGLLSIYQLQDSIDRRYGPFLGWVFSFFIFLISSYGMHLLRFYPLNGWKDLKEPLKLINNVMDSISLDTLYFMLLFTLFFTVIYSIFYTLLRIYKKDY